MGLDFFSKVRIFARSWNILKNWYVYPLVYFNLTKKSHVIFETKSGIKLKIRTKTTDLMALTNIWLIQEYLDDEFEIENNEIETFIANAIENNQDQKTEIERFYKKESNRNKLSDDLLDSKVLDLLKDNSKIVEKDMETSDLHHHHNH